MMEVKVERNTFGKTEKLCQKKAIDELFSNGKSFTVPFLKVILLEKEGQSECPVKVLIAVPKKNLRDAHDRNRMKRIIRESYRTRKHALHYFLKHQGRSLHLAFIFTGKDLLPTSKIIESIEKALQRIEAQFQNPQIVK